MNATNEVTVATEILNQLGGRRFIMMTGAKNILGDKDSLIFTLPRGTTRNKANTVVIKLDAMDTYTVTFYKASANAAVQCKVMGQFEGIYNDMLVKLFETETGLYTSL